MAVCPHCQQKDKNFFAQRCHNCNQYVSMGEQFLISSLYMAGRIATPFIFVWIIYSLLMWVGG
jgi:predicted ATP-dependent serine protease